jgi:hypothetical protein
MTRSVLVGVTVALAIIAGLVVFGVWVEGQVAEKNRAAKQQSIDRWERVNTACGSPPVSVTTHNARWSHGPWIEVRCRDGTLRAIHR